MSVFALCLPGEVVKPMGNKCCVLSDNDDVHVTESNSEPFSLKLINIRL